MSTEFSDLEYQYPDRASLERHIKQELAKYAGMTMVEAKELERKGKLLRKYITAEKRAEAAKAKV